MVTSLAVLTTAGFAWYTLSTNPEISGMQVTLEGDRNIWISKNGADFFRHIDISAEMSSEMSTLRPVSTYDGLNWYVCDYHSSSGNIIEDEFFLKDWCISEEHGTEGHTHCDNGGFFAYTDIWITTKAGSAKIRLSIPDSDERYGEEETSGCYVLSYDYSVDKEGVKTIKLMSRGPETCARVGFMVFDATSGEEDPVVLGKTENLAEKLKEEGFNKGYDFFIYEPNADVRSELNKQDSRYLTDIYVSQLRIKKLMIGDTAFDYPASNGSYMQTFPIKQAEAQTLEDTEEDSRGTLQQAAPALFPASKLIVQKAAAWNSAKVSEMEEKTFTEADNAVDLLNELMQNDCITRGRFANENTVQNALYNGANTYFPTALDSTPDTGNAASPTSQHMFTLKAGEIRQIRLFFWIEGQDIDCWNDVAGMNFLTRIEFAAE